jgi:ATP-dependent Clp protease ATP-binding subunit ClpC
MEPDDQEHSLQMFERFTESARRALFFARYEAGESGVRMITPEHLLLGLWHQAAGPLGLMLQHWKITPEVLRSRVEAGLAFGEKFPTSVEVPFSPDATRALHYAVEESDRLLIDYIGSEHLMLGIIRVGESHAARVLSDLGMRLDEAREVAAQLPPPHSEATHLGTSRIAFAADTAFGQIEWLLARLEQLDRRLTQEPGPRAMLENLRARLRELRSAMGL